MTAANPAPQARQWAAAEGLAQPSDRFLRWLGEGWDWRTIAAAARGLQTAPELAVLAHNDTWSVREAVAGNTSTATATLARLARDEDYEVRRAVALNRNTPAEALAVLVSDPDAAVALSALGHPACPLEARFAAALG